MDSDISIDFKYEPIESPLLIQSPTLYKGRKKSRPKQKSYRKKVESVWLHENIIKLIKEIEARPGLWDAGCIEYKRSKDISWQEVADAIQMSLNDCKGKWANLRTTFNYNLNKFKSKKGDQGTDEELQIVWRYFKPMMFLETSKVRQTGQSISSMQMESVTTDESTICDMGYTSSEGGKKSYRKKVESVWSHEDIIKLIEEIEARPGLWDTGCLEYKLSKDILWQEVADAIHVNLNDCKGKWANLRTSFNYNLTKFRRKTSGQGTDEQFQIVWRYFKPMMFLETTNVHQTRPYISTIQFESVNIDDSKICDMAFTDELRSTAPCTSGQQCKSELTMSSAPSCSGHTADLKDTSTIFAEYIAAELRNLSPDLAALARAKLRRAFNDILDEVVLMVPQQQ